MGTLLLAGALVGFFSNGMFGGYGAVISNLYPPEIRATANNVIINVGRAVGKFSPVVIGMLMENRSMTFIMVGLSEMYMISLLVMFTVPGLKAYSTESV